MGQLLVTLIVPPIVGVVTYIVVRRIWDRTRIVPKQSAGANLPLRPQAEEKPNGA